MKRFKWLELICLGLLLLVSTVAQDDFEEDYHEEEPAQLPHRKCDKHNEVWESPDEVNYELTEEEAKRWKPWAFQKAVKSVLCWTQLETKILNDYGEVFNRTSKYKLTVETSNVLLAKHRRLPQQHSDSNAPETVAYPVVSTRALNYTTEEKRYVTCKYLYRILDGKENATKDKLDIWLRPEQSNQVILNPLKTFGGSDQDCSKEAASDENPETTEPVTDEQVTPKPATPSPDISEETEDKPSMSSSAIDDSSDESKVTASPTEADPCDDYTENEEPNSFENPPINVSVTEKRELFPIKKVYVSRTGRVSESCEKISKHVLAVLCPVIQYPFPRIIEENFPDGVALVFSTMIPNLSSSNFLLVKGERSCYNLERHGEVNCPSDSADIMEIYILSNTRLSTTTTAAPVTVTRMPVETPFTVWNSTKTESDETFDGPSDETVVSSKGTVSPSKPDTTGTLNPVTGSPTVSSAFTTKEITPVFHAQPTASITEQNSSLAPKEITTITEPAIPRSDKTTGTPVTTRNYFVASTRQHPQVLTLRIEYADNTSEADCVDVDDMVETGKCPETDTSGLYVFPDETPKFKTIPTTADTYHNKDEYIFVQEFPYCYIFRIVAERECSDDILDNTITIVKLPVTETPTASPAVTKSISTRPGISTLTTEPTKELRGFTAQSPGGSNPVIRLIDNYGDNDTFTKCKQISRTITPWKCIFGPAYLYNVAEATFPPTLTFAKYHDNSIFSVSKYLLGKGDSSNNCYLFKIIADVNCDLSNMDDIILYKSVTSTSEEPKPVSNTPNDGQTTKMTVTDSGISTGNTEPYLLRTSEAIPNTHTRRPRFGPSESSATTMSGFVTATPPYTNATLRHLSGTAETVASYYLTLELNNHYGDEVVKTCIKVGQNVYRVKCRKATPHFFVDQSTMPTNIRQIYRRRMPEHSARRYILGGTKEKYCYYFEKIANVDCKEVQDNPITLRGFYDSSSEEESTEVATSVTSGTTVVTAEGRSHSGEDSTFTHRVTQSFHKTTTTTPTQTTELELKNKSVTLRLIDFTTDGGARVYCKRVSNFIRSSKCPENTTDMYYFIKYTVPRDVKVIKSEAYTKLENQGHTIVAKGVYTCYLFREIGSTMCPQDLKNTMTLYKTHSLPDSATFSSLYEIFLRLLHKKKLNGEAALHPSSTTTAAEPGSGTTPTYPATDWQVSDWFYPHEIKKQVTKIPAASSEPAADPHPFFTIKLVQTYLEGIHVKCRNVDKKVLTLPCPQHINKIYDIQYMNFPRDLNVIKVNTIPENFPRRIIYGKSHRTCYAFVNLGPTKCPDFAVLNLVRRSSGLSTLFPRATQRISLERPTSKPTYTPVTEANAILGELEALGRTEENNSNRNVFEEDVDELPENYKLESGTDEVISGSPSVNTKGNLTLETTRRSPLYMPDGNYSNEFILNESSQAPTDDSRNPTFIGRVVGIDRFKKQHETCKYISKNFMKLKCPKHIDNIYYLNEYYIPHDVKYTQTMNIPNTSSKRLAVARGLKGCYMLVYFNNAVCPKNKKKLLTLFKFSKKTNSSPPAPPELLLKKHTKARKYSDSSKIFNRIAKGSNHRTPVIPSGARKTTAPIVNLMERGKPAPTFAQLRQAPGESFKTREIDLESPVHEWSTGLSQTKDESAEHITVGAKSAAAAAAAAGEQKTNETETPKWYHPFVMTRKSSEEISLEDLDEASSTSKQKENLIGVYEKVTPDMRSDGIETSTESSSQATSTKELIPIAEVIHGTPSSVNYDPFVSLRTDIPEMVTKQTTRSIPAVGHPLSEQRVHHASPVVETTKLNSAHKTNLTGDSFRMRLVDIHNFRDVKDRCKSVYNHVISVRCPADTRNFYYVNETLIPNFADVINFDVLPASLLKLKSVVLAKGKSVCYLFKMLRRIKCPKNVDNILNIFRVYEDRSEDVYETTPTAGSVPEISTTAPVHTVNYEPTSKETINEEASTKPSEIIPDSPSDAEVAPETKMNETRGSVEKIDQKWKLPNDRTFISRLVHLNGDNVSILCKKIYKNLIRVNCPDSPKYLYTIHALQLPDWVKIVNYKNIRKLLQYKFLVARHIGQCYVLLEVGDTKCEDGKYRLTMYSDTGYNMSNLDYLKEKLIATDEDVQEVPVKPQPKVPQAGPVDTNLLKPVPEDDLSPTKSEHVPQPDIPKIHLDSRVKETDDEHIDVAVDKEKPEERPHMSGKQEPGAHLQTVNEDSEPVVSKESPGNTELSVDTSRETQPDVLEVLKPKIFGGDPKKEAKDQEVDQFDLDEKEAKVPKGNAASATSNNDTQPHGSPNEEENVNQVSKETISPGSGVIVNEEHGNPVEGYENENSDLIKNAKIFWYIYKYGKHPLPEAISNPNRESWRPNATEKHSCEDGFPLSVLGSASAETPPVIEYVSKVAVKVSCSLVPTIMFDMQDSQLPRRAIVVPFSSYKMSDTGIYITAKGKSSCYIFEVFPNVDCPDTLADTLYLHEHDTSPITVPADDRSKGPVDNTKVQPNAEDDTWKKEKQKQNEHEQEVEVTDEPKSQIIPPATKVEPGSHEMNSPTEKQPKNFIAKIIELAPSNKEITNCKELHAEAARTQCPHDRSKQLLYEINEAELGFQQNVILFESQVPEHIMPAHVLRASGDYGCYIFQVQNDVQCPENETNVLHMYRVHSQAAQNDWSEKGESSEGLTSAKQKPVPVADTNADVSEEHPEQKDKLAANDDKHITETKAEPAKAAAAAELDDDYAYNNQEKPTLTATESTQDNPLAPTKVIVPQVAEPEVPKLTDTVLPEPAKHDSNTGYSSVEQPDANEEQSQQPVIVKHVQRGKEFCYTIDEKIKIKRVHCPANTSKIPKIVNPRLIKMICRQKVRNYHSNLHTKGLLMKYRLLEFDEK